jgi:hypothetical protein
MSIRMGALRGLLVLSTVGALALAWAPGALGQRVARVGQPAPELTGGPWINSPPLSLGTLRGRVVFVEFWTYG